MAFGSRRSLAGGLSDNEDTTHRIWNMTEFDPEGTSHAPAAPDTPGQDREPNTPFVFPPMPSPAVIRDSHRLSYRRSLGRGRRSTFGIGAGASPGDILARTPGQQARLPRFSTASLLPYSPTSQGDLSAVGDTSMVGTDYGDDGVNTSIAESRVSLGGQSLGQPSPVTGIAALPYDPFAPRPDRRARTRRSTGLALRKGGLTERGMDAGTMPMVTRDNWMVAEDDDELTPEQLEQAYGSGVNSERPEEIGFASLLSTHESAVDFSHTPGSNDVFAMLYRFEQMCHDRQTGITRELRATAISPGLTTQIKRLKHSASLLKDERDTWRLIRALYIDRSQVEVKQLRGEDGQGTSTLDAIRHHWSEHQIVSRLFETNDSVRQYQIVISWLERLAGEDLRYVPDDASWSQTLQELRRRTGYGNLITEVDPDAPIRQQRQQHDDDMDKDKILMANIWRLVRCGRLGAAQELCRQSRQPWRAATLGGSQLFHDPFLAGSSDQETSGPVGNRTRNTWKAAARTMCEQEGLDPNERSVYGVLAGDLDAALTVCQSWTDTLWAHFKILVDRHVDAELKTYPNFFSDDRPQHYPSNEDLFSPADILEYARSQAMSKSGIENRYHQIQEHVILGGSAIATLGNLMQSWVTAGETCPPELLRFCAHLVLFFSVVAPSGDGNAIRDDAARIILQTYTEHLIATGQRDIVALYVSRLPSDVQSTMYARFLEGITNSRERDQCLALARQAGLEVTSITKAVVSNIRGSAQNDVSKETLVTNQVTEADLNKIRALEWLCFDPTQRAEALKQSNELIIEFIASGKVDAAAILLREVLPPDTVSKLEESWISEVPISDEHVVRQHQCLRALIDAYSVHEQWSQHHSRKPRDPGPAPDNSTLHSVRIQWEHNRAAYQADIGHWKANEERNTETSAGAIATVLTWEGGWLLPSQRTAQLASDNESRRIEDVRRMWIPRLVLMLHRCLHESGMYQRALSAVDLVADERYKVYSVCTQDDLRQILRLAMESKLSLMSQEQGAV